MHHETHAHYFTLGTTKNKLSTVSEKWLILQKYLRRHVRTILTWKTIFRSYLWYKVSTSFAKCMYFYKQESTYFSHNLSWNDCFTNNRLSSSFYPVYSSRFFVCTVVTTDSYNLKVRKLFIQPCQCFFSALLERNR